MSLVGSLKEEQRSPIISFVNPFSYVKMEERKDLVDEVDYFFSDGAMLCFFHNLFYKRIKRASFDYSSVADPFFKYLEDKNFSVAIIGAKKNEIDLCVARIRQRHPRLKVVYFRDGYYSDIKIVSDDLNRLSPDFLLLGLGAPFQEISAVEYRRRGLPSKCIITCGGFITQTSIRADYYHSWIKALGLRWLQRMFLHRHVRVRVFKDYPIFILRYLYRRE